jgi:hypothetical protein
MKEKAPKAGNLIMGHSMAIMSQIGLLPTWIHDHAVVYTDSRYMEHFHKQFSFDKHLMCGAGLDKFTKIIQTAMETRYGMRFSSWKLENVLCKLYRINGSKGMLWWDLTFPWQIIFSFDGDFIQIISPSGQLVQEMAGALINHWPYRSELLPIDAIGRRMGLASIMPMESATSNHRIEEYLLYPRAVLHQDFELDIPDRGSKQYPGYD